MNLNMKLMYYLMIVTQNACFILGNCQNCFKPKVSSLSDQCNFFYRSDRSKTLNYLYLKTTCPIDLKSAGLSWQVN